MGRSERKLQRIKDKKLAVIEKKYNKIVGKLLEDYKDREMAEFWAECDKIKEEMRKEIESIGYNMD